MSRHILHRPPKWADRFLEWYCDENLVNEVQGDLHEIYYLRAEKHGYFKARFLFVWEVIKSFKKSNIKRSDRFKNSNYFNLIINNSRVSVRNLMKHKFYSFIKILGLAIGLASVILISSFVYNEKSFDRFHENADNIYRIIEKHWNDQGVIEEYSASVPIPVGPTLMQDFPDLKTVRFYQTFQKTPLLGNRKKDRNFYEAKLFFTDSTFFDIFTFKLIKGNPSTVLDQPNSIVITETQASKYFDDEDPMGQTLRFENALDFIVTGVAEDPPVNSHIDFDFLASFINPDAVLEASGNTFGSRGWYWNPTHTYVLLPENVEKSYLESILPSFVQKYFPDFIKDNLELPVQALTDIHLTTDLYQEIQPNRDPKSIYMAMAIALFIILIALINFMNLSAARSSQRAKEVALRKIIGSSKKQLFYQFLTESLITSFIALILAIGLVFLLIHPFEQITDSKINYTILLHPVFITATLGFTVTIGLLAGFYPALLATSFKPIDALKVGNLKLSSKKSPIVWKGLVVFQFAISIILIIGAVIVNQQHQFLLSKDLGFDKEQVVIIPIRGTSVKEKSEAFKAELFRESTVISASAMSDILGNDVPLRPFLFEGQTEAHNIPGLFADFDFIKTFGLNIKEGRDLSKDMETDKEAFLINESAASVWEDGQWQNKSIRWGGQNRSVVGLVEDFHFADLNQAIRPLVLTYDPGWHAYMAVRIQPGQIFQSMQRLEAIWAGFEPDRPFTPFFLDDRLNTLYEQEQKISQMISYFSVISIFLASLGLLGLTNYATLLRVKEIGVRKVLGASVFNILKLLSKDYTLLIIIANLVAWPIAWLMAQEWLANFAFKITLSPWVLIIAGLSTLVVSLLTICMQGLKTALINPSESLRNE